MDLPRRRLGEHIRDATTLTDWQRETLLLRIGVLCRAEYEWAVRHGIARRIGMEDSDIDRIVTDSDAVERALLRATDQLFRDVVISNEAWAALAEEFRDRAIAHDRQSLDRPSAPAAAESYPNVCR